MPNAITWVRNHTVNSYAGRKLLHTMVRSFLLTKNPIYADLYRRDVHSKIPRLVSVPTAVVIENTNICNLSCVFCAHSRMAREQGIMTDELYRNVIHQAVSMGIQTAVIQGFGEPLIDPAYVQKIAHAKQSGINTVYCVTNGILLTPDICDGLLNAGLDVLCVSIDAATEDTYQRIHRCADNTTPSTHFTSVVRNLQYLIAARERTARSKPRIQVRFKDFERNKGELMAFVNAYQNQVDDTTIYMNIAHWPGSGMDDTLPKNRRSLRFPCYNLWSTMYVAYDGRIGLCCQDYDLHCCLGTVSHGGLAAVWHGRRLASIRTAHLSGDYDCTVPCADCVINTQYITPWWP